MALNLSPSPVYWTPLLYTVFGIGAVFLIYQLFVWKQQNQWITACEQAFGPLDKEQKDGIAKIVRAFMDYGDKDPTN